MTDAQEFADLLSQKIEGWSDHKGIMRIPLMSHIATNLWMGGCRPGAILPSEFKFVVSLYPWERYAVEEETQHETYVWMRDCRTLPDTRLLLATADWINTARAIGPVLVHCQAGINRSSLVTAMALIRAGSSPENAISLIRQKRSPECLSNKTFERFILEYPA